jgi:hypothetical protein
MKSVFLFPNNHFSPNFFSKRGVDLALFTEILQKTAWMKKINLRYIINLFEDLYSLSIRSNIVTEEMLRKYIK